MTTAALGWFFAGICFSALIFIWFGTSYRELSAKRRNLDAISEQIAMHRKLFMQLRGGPDDASAQNVLASKRIAYGEAKKNYDATTNNLLHYIPAYVLGLRTTEKQDNPWPSAMHAEVSAQHPDESPETS